MKLSQVVPALSPGGAVSKNMESFEHRQQQQQMAQAVCDALDQDLIYMVEAGTGTGKSLAYGLPMAVWALEHEQRIVISTGTINLQQQLVAKDLPLVSRVLGKELNVVLVKGRANYLCRRRLSDQVRQINLFEPGAELAMLPLVAQWAESTTDGSRSDLDKPVPDSLWSKVCADSDACLGKKCPMISQCFVQRARNAAEDAQILVVNHHLLFADLALRTELGDWERTAVLPPFDRLVLDEAHGLEDAASAFFGSRVSRKGALGLLSSLSRAQRGDAQSSGVFHDIQQQYKAIGGQGDYGGLSSMAADARAVTDKAFDLLVEFTKEHLDKSLFGEKKLRLGKELMISPGWVAVGQAFREASASLDKLAASMHRIVEEVESQSDETSATVEGRSGAKSLSRLAESFRTLTEPQEAETDDEVRWVELGSNASGRFVSIASAPLDLAEKFNEAIYDTMSSVVMTSATLTVNGSFDYQVKRLGLDLLHEHRTRTLSLDSPFDFASSAVLAVALDAPSPSDKSFETWLPDAIVQLAKASTGGALVLFTSWKLMTSAFDECLVKLESSGMEVLCQGKAPRHRLLARFRHNPSSVLFGTHSFWQGIDVAGDSLRLVIVTKLPFDVPSEPIMQARSERLDNPFIQLSLPRAVLRLKQGFGRLIRTTNDKGGVVVLDSRITTKNYGRTFIKSLPEVPLLQMGLEDICTSLPGLLRQ